MLIAVRMKAKVVVTLVIRVVRAGATMFVSAVMVLAPILSSTVAERVMGLKVSGPKTLMEYVAMQ